jgi:hypothetical protein
VRHQPLELVLGAVRGEVGDLRLEGEHQIARRVDDARAEVEDAAGVAAPRGGELRRVRIEADAEQRIVVCLAARQPLDEVHAASAALSASRAASSAALPV